MLPIEQVASACGSMSLAQGIGNIMGPPLAGYIYDHSTDHKIILFIIAIGYIISGISCSLSGYLLNRTRNVNTMT